MENYAKNDRNDGFCRLLWTGVVPLPRFSNDKFVKNVVFSWKYSKKWQIWQFLPTTMTGVVPLPCPRSEVSLQSTGRSIVLEFTDFKQYFFPHFQDLKYLSKVREGLLFWNLRISNNTPSRTSQKRWDFSVSLLSLYHWGNDSDDCDTLMCGMRSWKGDFDRKNFLNPYFSRGLRPLDPR